VQSAFANKAQAAQTGTGAPGGMNVNGPVYVVVNRATPQEIQQGIEDWSATYR
jgi:hypothetical protein